MFFKILNLAVDEALKDYQTVLTMEPRHVAANKAVRTLPTKIEERNEKMKAEMIDNLKVESYLKIVMDEQQHLQHDDEVGDST